MKQRSILALFIGMMLGINFSGLFSQEKPACKWLEKPVDEQTFKTYLDFFVYDKNLAFDFRSLDVKEQEGIRKEHLSFESTPGERLYANMYSAAGSSSKKEPAIIILHGGSPQGKDSPSCEDLASLFARAGWRVISIDLKFFGERSSGLLTTFTETEKHEKLYNKPSLYLSWMIQNVKDVSRSFDFLVQHEGADPRRIGLLGLSRGAVVAAIAGAAEQRLAATVLLHGGHFDALEREHLPAACPGNYIGRMSPRPLLMINALHDADFIRETSALPLYNLARFPKKIIWIEGGHSAMTEEARSAMIQWLRDNIK